MTRQPSHLMPILLLAYHLGQRFGEIVQLTWDRVDLQRGFIALRPIDTKTKKPRQLPITPAVRTALADLAKVRRLNTNHVFLYEGQPIRGIKRGCNTAKSWREWQTFILTIYGIARPLT